MILHIAGIGKSLTIVKTDVRKLILVHTTGIYSKYKAAGESYRQIETQIETLVEPTGKELTFLRPTMIYGTIKDMNVIIFMKMVDKLRVFPVFNGAKYELQPVWCGDLGKAYYQILMNQDTATKRNYNLSGGAPILLLDMFKVMAKYLCVTNTFVSVPFKFAYTLSWILYLSKFTKIDFREKVQHLVEPRTFSYEDAAHDFAYSPLTFEEGVRAEIEEYKAQKKKKVCSK